MFRAVQRILRAKAVLVGVAIVGVGCQSIPTARAEGGPPVHSKRIVGWVERAVMLPGGAPVYAKLDTGAKTSSLHAEEIERFEKDGAPWIRFTAVLEGPKDTVRRERFERPVHREVRIKDHDDPADSRPVVELDFCLDGRRERAEFSLTDRSGFLYSVLLGRRFLADRFVVDPGETFEAERGCPDTTTAEDADG